MSQRRLQRNLANLGRAVAQLEEAIRIPRDRPLVAEGTVQRFEFVIELFWKTLKRGLEFEGKPTKTPREALREAYAARWIDDETIWLDMLQCRNDTSHLYLDPALLEQTYDRIRGYSREMRRMLTFLEDRFRDAV
jgi:nucleotidyltransferase substrate binding protein (TIGR01987 family)